MTLETRTEHVLSTASANDTSLAIQVPQGCVLLQFLDFNPYDNPDSLVSQDQERAFAAFISSVLLPVFFLIAVPGNLITAIVFYRHGLKERVNLCVFSQALLDLGYIVNVMFNIGDAIFYGFDNKGRTNVVGDWYVTNHLNGFYGFDVSSKVLTTVIACERCVCVARPLKAQGLMKTRTMAVVIALVVSIFTGLTFIANSRWSMRCLYNPASNTTSSALMLSDFYLENKSLVDFLDFTVCGVMVPGTTITTVSTTTAYTAFKLKQMTVWRQNSTSAATALSRQDIALTRMLIGTSILFVTCSSVYFGSRILGSFHPDFDLDGRQANLYILISYLTLALGFFNPSLNFFIFYSLGSRFRSTVREILCKPASGLAISPTVTLESELPEKTESNVF